MRLFVFLPLLLTAALLQQRASAEEPAEFPAIVDSQPPGESPPTPEQAAAGMRAPEGFQVRLFAGEPQVNQPIAFDIDDRGRLWVVECYSYAGRGFDDSMRDRIVILEDTDNDGRHDRRTVFWDQGHRMSSVTWGFGGAWILNNGALQFLPDRDGDDVPDGPPEDRLDGFDIENSNHNIVNGLLWGPDGWLYGRHGILATSRVGRPGFPDAERTQLNCAIWRYHPLDHRFEVLTHGTTNPWGMDYDDWGELFFTNNVIGHLWHVVPGAHFERMYGNDFNPHLYELIGQTADHYHWDHRENWTDSRDAVGKHGELGGGHSHCGGLIYLGGRWPAEHRNAIFMCNTHGRRVNVNRLERAGCGYAGRRAPDFLFANTPWFRGVDLKSGPDGDVYITDWTDLGECHDNDGVHRTSGRVYKVIYGEPAPRPEGLDRPLAERSDDELVSLQLEANDWWVRRARRLLQERHAAGRDLGAARRRLVAMAQGDADATRRLRALWALHVTGGAPRELLVALLGAADEHLRTWAVRLLAERAPDDEILSLLVERARRDDSGLVRLHLASTLQRLPLERRWPLAEALAARSEDAADPVQPLLVWYGVEAATPGAPDRAVATARATEFRSLRRHLARRLTVELESAAAPVDALLSDLDAHPAEYQQDILRGMAAALRGWRRAPTPTAWEQVRTRLAKDAEVQSLAKELAVVFGDGRAMGELLAAVQDAARDTAERRSALQVLIDGRVDGLAPILQGLLADRGVNDLAASGLASFDHPDTAKRIIERFGGLRGEARSGALATLVSRATYAAELLEAVANGAVPKSELTAVHARQIASLGDDRLAHRLSQVWGTIRATPAEKRARMEELKRELPKERLQQADLGRGRQLFKQHCAACHRLYGDGERIGPDLTGSQRDNLDFWLDNLIDPSAVVAAEFRMTALRMHDGRVINGVLGRETGPTVTVQTPKEKLVIRRDEIEESKPSELSLMPDGLLQPLSPDEIRDLFGHLSRRDPP